MWLNSLQFHIVNHHLASFSDHRPCDSSDKAGKIFFVALQDHMIKGSGNFMERESSVYIPTLPKMISIDIHSYFS